jgi:uncharacterized Zn-finger protein
VMKDKKQGMCTWKEDEDGHWWTDCKHIHSFFDGGVDDNEYLYCPYCGAVINEEKYRL